MKKVLPGDSFLIMGAGQVGLLCAQIAKSLHAGKVIVSDISDFRLGKALQLGADETVNVAAGNLREAVRQSTAGKGVDIAIIAASVPSLLPESLECLSPGGTVIVFAPFPPAKVGIDASKFFTDEIAIVGSYSSMPEEYDVALDMIGKGVIDVGAMVTHRMKLWEMNEAIELATNPVKEVLKIMIEPEAD